MAMFGLYQSKKEKAEAEARAKSRAELAALEKEVASIRPASLARGEKLDLNRLPAPAAGNPKPQAPKQQMTKDDFKDSPYNLKERIRKRGRNSMPEM